MEEKQHLLTFYVYELRDPRDNAVFYVGKGQRNRLQTHDDDDEDKNYQQSAKSARISKIKEANLKPLRIIIGRYETETEAFAVESTLIKWTYGIDNLTNRINGHRHKFVRPHSQASEFCGGARSPYRHIQGIDMERSESRSNTGEYTAELRQRAKENGVEEKLEALQDYLKPLARKFGATVNEPDMLRPMDPKLVIHINDQVVMVDIKLQLTGKDVVIKLVHRPGRNNAETFSKFVSTLGRAEEIKKANTNERYFWFDGNGKIPIDNSDAIWDRVSKGLTMIKGASETT